MGRDTKGDQEYRSYIIGFFDRYTSLYDPFLSLFRLRSVRRETVEISGVRRKDKVLDVCTGTGDVALEFARWCGVTGVDLSSGMLAVARKKDRDGRVCFLQMDATRLGFADKQFDVSVISFGLHDMPPEVREETLREMARVTRQRIVIVDYNPPRNPILQALYIAIVSLWESKYFPEFAIDFQRKILSCYAAASTPKVSQYLPIRALIDWGRLAK